MRSPCPRCGAEAEEVCPRCGIEVQPGPRLPEPGQLFAGRYRIGEVLGRGGMGVVYRARDLTLNDDVALKVIRPDLLDRPQVLARFVREVTLARKLAHPNICRIHDLGEAQGLRYISMQLVEGESLESILRREGKLSSARVGGIADRLLLALAAAHERGVVHRDLKPRNVMVDRRGEPVLMDFGIAKDMEPARPGRETTLAGISMGTPAYMAPEVALGDPATPLSDLYSLGITLFKLLVGKLPFEGDSAYAILRKQVETPPPRIEELRPDIDPVLASFLHRILEKDPRARFSSAAQAREFLLGEPTTGASQATLASARAPAAPRLARRPALWIGSALVLLASIGLLGVVRRGRGPAAAPVVAVLPFREGTALGPAQGAGSVVADMLLTSLGRGGGLKVVSRLKLEQLARDAPDALSPLSAVVRGTGATRIVTGSVLASGGRLRIEAQVVDARSGEVVLSARREGDQGASLFDLVDPLAEELADGLGGVAPGAPVASLTTASFEAYRAYDRGMSAFVRGELGRARAAFREAVSTDEAFALAWSRLAQTAEQLGHRREARDAIARALRASERLDSVDREQVRGAARLMERRYDQALGHFERVLRERPGDPLALIAAGECQMGRRAWGQAAARFEQAVKADPRLALGYERIGQAWLGQRQYDAALRWFEAQARESPRSALPHVGLGRTWLRRHDIPRAEAAFQAALQAEPDFLSALLGLGDAARARHDTAGARRHYLAAGEAVPEALGPLLALGQLALEERRPEQAERHFHDALERDRMSGEALVGLGQTHLSRGRFDEARSWFERAIEADRWALEPRLALARLLERERRLGEALAVLEAAARVDPFEPRVLLRRGQLFRQERRFEAAWADAEGARALDAFEPEALNLLGLIEDDKTLWEQAASWYEKAVEVDRHYTFARNNLGVVKAQQHELKVAMELLEQAVADDPYEAVSYANLGQVHGLAGNAVEARRWFARAREIDPRSIEALLAEASWLRGSGMVAAALPLLERARALNPRDDRVALERGHALRGMGRGAEAATAFEEAAGLSPGPLHAELELAAMELKAGQGARARKRLEAAVRREDGRGAWFAARVLEREGQRELALGWLERALAAEPASAWLAFDGARLYVRLGEKERALQALAAALERGFDDLLLLRNTTDLEPLRGDPRYVELVGKAPAARR